MSRLNHNAREYLKGNGITQAAWARWNGWRDGVWHGDACGCPDDRCAGYHHDDDAADCGCLRSLAQDFDQQIYAAAKSGTVAESELHAGRFGWRYPTL